MLVSLALQAIAIVTGVVLSIISVEKLGAVALPQPMPPVPRAPKFVRIINVQQRAAASSSAAIRVPAARSFVVPSRIPAKAAEIHDAPELQIAKALAFTAGSCCGVPGAIGSPDGDPTGSTIPAVPPPPAVVKNEPANNRKPIRVGGDVLAAKLVTRVMPVYPQLALRARISGTVRLEGVIARDGRITNLQVVQGHPLLVRAALEAVRQWVYRPTLLNGQPVEVIAPIDVHFTLSQ